MKKKERTRTTPTMAISPDDNEMFVVGEDCKFYCYNMNDQKESKCVSSNFTQQAVVCLAYSPQKTRHIWVCEPRNKGQSSYQFHNSVPMSLEWTNDSKMSMSGGRDNNIYILLEATGSEDESVKIWNTQLLDHNLMPSQPTYIEELGTLGATSALATTTEKAADEQNKAQSPETAQILDKNGAKWHTTYLIHVVEFRLIAEYKTRVK